MVACTWEQQERAGPEEGQQGWYRHLGSHFARLQLTVCTVCHRPRPDLGRPLTHATRFFHPDQKRTVDAQQAAMQVRTYAFLVTGGA